MKTRKTLLTKQSVSGIIFLLIFSEHKKCGEINRFNKASFTLGKSNYSPQSIYYNNEYNGEKLDGFNSVMINSDDNAFLELR